MKTLLQIVCKLSLVLFLLFGAAVTAPDAQANSKYASVVMDMESGEILRSRNADKKLYPASLTKMMTLYLVFEAIEDGRLSLDQNVPISRTAARQPPSKLGLRSGKSIVLRHAITACATKSANDAAVVLAEAVGGSVKNFAAMMNAKARELGMRNTRFKNPHGLTKKGQLSTARDMAVLSRRLFLDHPAHYHFFKRKSFRYGGRKFRATNKLLGKYKGADGIKTGYTRASGFNLAASAEQDGRRILGVVFGGKSSARRNRHMVKLLDEGFRKMRKRAPRTVLIASPLPRYHPSRGPAPTIAQIPGSKPPEALVALAQGRDTSVVRRGLKAISEVIVTPAEAAAPIVSTGGWSVQVGAYRKRSAAERRLKATERVLPANLNRAAPIVSVRNAGGRPLYRARYAGLQKKEADRGCKTFSAKGIDCFVVNGN